MGVKDIEPMSVEQAENPAGECLLHHPSDQRRRADVAPMEGVSVHIRRTQAHGRRSPGCGVDAGSGGRTVLP